MVFVLPIAHNESYGLCVGDMDLDEMPDFLFHGNDFFVGDISYFLTSDGLTERDFFKLWEEDPAYMEIIASGLFPYKLNYFEGELRDCKF